MALLKVKMADRDEWLDVMLANISSSGFMVRSAAIPPMGATVHLQHRGTALKGKVVWTTRTRFGVESYQKIDLSALFAKSGLDAKAALGTPERKAQWWHWRNR
jgi:hypothetical protein